MLAEHQRAAVERLRGLLARYGGAILADDVGLGKSFVAAEIARLSEHDGIAVEVIVPAALVPQWRATLRRFGVEAPVFTFDSLVSTPFVPQPRRRLVIVDEAHALRNASTLRFDAVAKRTIAAEVLLVTATPVCNSIRDLESLLAIVARDDVLSAEGVPSIDAAFAARDAAQIATIVSTLVLRRERAVLPERLRFGVLRRRVVRHSLPRVAAQLAALRFPLVGEAAMVRRFLVRRLESSEEALDESLVRQRRFYERALDCLAAGRPLPKREYRRVFGHAEDVAEWQHVLFWEVFVPPGESTGADEVEAEVKRIDELRGALAKARGRKLAQLREIMPESPSLIFTGFAATARALFASLRAQRRCGLVIGSERRAGAEALDAFTRGLLDVVVSTDVGAEGLNLQRAGTVIHYDVPWNPVKLDQRNGRAFRIGQARPAVDAIYFLPRVDDSRIIHTVVSKNRARRRALRTLAALPWCGGASPRPRLTAAAAISALARAAPYAELPQSLFRRHRAGLERLIGQLACEALDERKLADLLALAACSAEGWVG